jgi:hypothetical protein
MSCRRHPSVPRIEFGSCYVYSPRGLCAASARSRVLCALLKAGDADFLSRYAWRVRRLAAEQSSVSDLFDARSVLVPVPGYRPWTSGTPSVTERLAAAYVREGLGRLAWAGLRRLRAVRKSGTSSPADRPTLAEHFESFVVDDSIAPPERIVLIDDVITRGRTLLAAAARLQRAFPTTHIAAFALVRTMGFVADIERLIAPCRGEICCRNGDAHRNP